MCWSLPGSSVHGILQARILEWVAIPFSRESSQPRVQAQVSCIAGWLFTICATRYAQIYVDRMYKDNQTKCIKIIRQQRVDWYAVVGLDLEKSIGENWHAFSTKNTPQYFWPSCLFLLVMLKMLSSFLTVKFIKNKNLNSMFLCLKILSFINPSKVGIGKYCVT